MSQTTELTRVKARIKALAEKTVSNGCTEAEAMAAAEMVGRLLERYALSMEEIDIREERCVQVEVPIGGKRRRPIDGCITAIARFCDCKVWVSRDAMMPTYVFFGFDADTALASYLFNIIDRAMVRDALERRFTVVVMAGKYERAYASVIAPTKVKPLRIAATEDQKLVPADTSPGAIPIYSLAVRA